MARDCTSLKRRAVVFALVAGVVAFMLALIPAVYELRTGGPIWRAVIVAIVVAAMCWATAERSVSMTAAAIDAAIERLVRGARGDLDSAIPAEVGESVPQLSRAMADLFTQLRAGMASIERMALFDTVTALPNRDHFRARCDATLAGLGPSAQSALLFIDLDRFKRVNDTLGHAAGDILLGEVAARLRQVAAATAPVDGAPPLVGRLAGDEFTVFLPHIAAPADAHCAAQAVLTALTRPFDVGGHQVALGASIGLALRPEHGRGLAELMKAADTAMYSAKEGGRGRVEPFGPALAARLAERASLDEDLRAAVSRADFALVFQPQVATADGRIVAAEALLRWDHPRDGVRRPASFIHRAEENGLIVEIGDWVVDRVATTIARWDRLGLSHRLSINVSPRQVDHAGFFRRLQEALLAAGAPTRLLELELTESLAMAASDEVLAALAELRAAGATIAIDDFGTGYSSVARLRTLPVDRVKLDRSLVAGVADDATTRVIAQALVGLIHGLGCEAVAEGVEDPAEAEVLRVIGCDAVQGYAIATPMDEAGFLAWAAGPQPAATLSSSAA